MDDREPSIDRKAASIDNRLQLDRLSSRIAIQ
jgi:hypothetical protein